METSHVGASDGSNRYNLIFYKSPVGKSLIGKNVGDFVTVNTPSGEKNYEILNVKYI